MPADDLKYITRIPIQKEEQMQVKNTKISAHQDMYSYIYIPDDGRVSKSEQVVRTN